jgi:hypothetical protein
MTTAITKPDRSATENRILSRLIESGDISGLTEQQRCDFYYLSCAQAGLDPSTRPFDYIKQGGKIALYPNQRATAQLSAKHGLTIEITDKATMDGLYVFTAKATRKDGSFVEEIGVVPVPTSPTDKANAMMKASGKAKRRAVIAARGLAQADSEEREDRTIRSEALDGGLEPSPEILEAAIVPSGPKLSEKISIKIDENAGLTSKAIAAMLTENNIDPKLVDTLPEKEHDRVLKLVDALAGTGT